MSIKPRHPLRGAIFVSGYILIQLRYMTNATLELYHALIEAGVSEDKAEAAAKAVMTKTEARELLGNLVTKAEFYKALMLQAGVIVGLQALVATLA